MVVRGTKGWIEKRFFSLSLVAVAATASKEEQQGAGYEQEMSPTKIPQTIEGCILNVGYVCGSNEASLGHACRLAKGKARKWDPLQP